MEKYWSWGSFFIGMGAGVLLLFCILVANMTPCIKCKSNCLDSANYCSECGQQLKIIKVE